jgi:hypothetical protein
VSSKHARPYIKCAHNTGRLTALNVHQCGGYSSAVRGIGVRLRMGWKGPITLVLDKCDSCRCCALPGKSSPNFTGKIVSKVIKKCFIQSNPFTPMQWLWLLWLVVFTFSFHTTCNHFPVSPSSSIFFPSCQNVRATQISGISYLSSPATVVCFISIYVN